MTRLRRRPRRCARLMRRSAELHTIQKTFFNKLMCCYRARYLSLAQSKCTSPPPGLARRMQLLYNYFTSLYSTYDNCKIFWNNNNFVLNFYDILIWYKIFDLHNFVPSGFLVELISLKFVY